MRKGIIFVLSFSILGLLSSTKIYGSGSNNDSVSIPKVYSASLKFQYGKLIDIYPNYPKSEGVFVFEGEWNLHTSSSRMWYQLYNFPEIGASLLYQNYGNKDVLGYSVSLYPHLKFESVFSNKLSLKYKVGLGLAFFNKPFNEVTNPDNFVIGGNFAAIATGSLLSQYKLDNKNFILAGLGFLHYSNGHTKVPNVGANAFTLILGTKHLLNNEDPIRNRVKNLKKIDGEIKLGVTMGFGLHEFEGGEFPTGGPKYPVYMGSIYLTSRLTRVVKFSTGLDINYFSSYHNYMITHQLFNDKEKLRSISLVYYLGHELLLGKLSFLWQAGLNIYNPFNVQAKVFNTIHRELPNLFSSNKFGFRYYFTALNLEKLKSTPYVGINIKSHVGVADFVEINVGYLF